MDFKNLTDDQLLQTAKIKVGAERQATLQVLHLLREVERRGLHLARGFSSLFVFCVESLGYSEGEANRRISAMRLLREIPEVEEKIREGELNLTTVAQTQQFFRAEKKQGASYDLAKKREVLNLVANKSSREVEKELLTLAPRTSPAEKVRTLTAELTELRVVLDSKLSAKLEELKMHLSHVSAQMTYAELLAWATDAALEKARRRKVGGTPKGERQVLETKANAVAAAPRVAPHEAAHKCELQAHANEITRKKKSLLPAKVTRFIPAPVRSAIWRRDDGRCSFVDSATGRRCGSRFRLEIDHIKPWALGGESDRPENLRLLCRAHNLLKAREDFGEKHMGRFVRQQIEADADIEETWNPWGGRPDRD